MPRKDDVAVLKEARNALNQIYERRGIRKPRSVAEAQEIAFEAMELLALQQEINDPDMSALYRAAYECSGMEDLRTDSTAAWTIETG